MNTSFHWTDLFVRNLGLPFIFKMNYKERQRKFIEKHRLMDSEKELLAHRLIYAIESHFGNESGIVVQDGNIKIISSESSNYNTVIRALTYIIRHTKENVYHNDLEKLTDMWMMEIVSNVFKGGFSFNGIKNIEIKTDSRNDDNSFKLIIQLNTLNQTHKLLRKDFRLSELDELTHIVHSKIIESVFKLVTIPTFYKLMNILIGRFYDYLGASLNSSHEDIVCIKGCNVKKCDEVENTICIKCKSVCFLKQERIQAEKEQAIKEAIEHNEKEAIRKELEAIEKYKGTFLYFLHDEHLNKIKIGRSSNLLQRKRNIETTIGFRLNVLAIWANAGHLEKPLHKKFKEYRLLGEWFKDVPEIREYIESENRNQIVISIENIAA